MRRMSPPSNSHAHDHEWESPRGCALYYEDGAVHLEEECIYVEEKYVGEARGEAFYETMYECDARRMHRFDLVQIDRLHEETVRLAGVETRAVETLAAGAEEVRSLYDERPSLVEETESAAAERLCQDGELFDHISIRGGVAGASFSIDVSTEDGNTYRLHYEWTEVNRA